MTKRTKSRQTKHDKKVKQVAERLKRQGWTVEADLPGYDRPRAIGKGRYIPDVVARRSGAERIIEVETSETREADKKQQEAFRRSAARKKRTSFQIEEA